MAHFESTTIDKLIKHLTVLVFIGGGLMVHVLTALTINSYYSSPWGFISFLLPGFAEIYLLSFQLNADMFYYKLMLTGFLILSGVVLLMWLLNNFISGRVEKPTLHSNPSHHHS